MNIKQLKNILQEKEQTTRGTYNKGLYLYALELVDNIGDHYASTQEQRDNLQNIDRDTLKELALNGAEDWGQYSWGGCSLCYNYDILERLFCPSMVKRYQNADSVRGLHLLDFQKYALCKAFAILYKTIQNG